MAKEKEGRNGCWGKILQADLSTGKIAYRELEDSWYRRFLGGIGIGAKFLWDSGRPGCDPLGSGNILGFTPGLLTDTGTVFTGRFTVVAKSPASAGWGDSNCGGYFSPLLKRCGIDGLLVQGSSEKPVYLYVDQEGAELKDASGLWGKDSLESEQMLKATYGRTVQVACIGTAGERLSTMAGICNDGGRIAARCGLGAVMGSKRLKGVVANGKKRVTVADRETIRALNRTFLKSIDRLRFVEPLLGDRMLNMAARIGRPGMVYPRQPAEIWRLLLRKFGTPALTAMSAENGDSPVKNWSGVGSRDFPLNRSVKISAEALKQHELRRYGCYSCPLRCGAKVAVAAGPYPVREMHKPEYETICAFGALLLNDDLPTVYRINDLLNRAGMDTISCGAAVAFAIECFENGILSPADTDGLELRWGNGRDIVRLVEKIIQREGLGDLLADGVRSASGKIGGGSERFAVHCGGVEAPMHDPKFDPGFLFSFSCEPTPGRHTISSLQYLDLQRIDRQFSTAGKPPLFSTRWGRFRCEDKAKDIAIDSFYKMLVDCAGACLFGTQVGGPLPLCDWMNAATGWDLSNDEYLDAGERVHALRHAFNIREGLNPIRDFRPHARICGEPPLSHGPGRGITIDFDALAGSYYKAMGWDLETGKPSPVRLKTLGLDEVAEALHPHHGGLPTQGQKP